MKRMLIMALILAGMMLFTAGVTVSFFDLVFEVIHYHFS